MQRTERAGRATFSCLASRAASITGNEGFGGAEDDFRVGGSENTARPCSASVSARGKIPQTRITRKANQSARIIGAERGNRV